VRSSFHGTRTPDQLKSAKIIKEKPSRVIFYEDPTPEGIVVRERASEILKMKTQRKPADEGLAVTDPDPWGIRTNPGPLDLRGDAETSPGTGRAHRKSP
jgi:hypothetical protein